MEGTTDGVQEVAVSATDLTRIAIQGSRIATTKQLAGSSATVEPDQLTGQAFVTLDKRKAARLFVISTSGRTHTLQLTPTDDPVSCIVIREPAATPMPGAVPMQALMGSQGLGSAGTGAQSSGSGLPTLGAVSSAAGGSDARGTVQTLIGQMARSERGWDSEVVRANREVPLWAESRFVLVEQYKGRGYIGEHYRLTNVSGKTMRLAEQEFYKQGVVAVSIELHELASGDSTEVFVVTTRGAEQ